MPSEWRDGGSFRAPLGALALCSQVQAPSSNSRSGSAGDDVEPRIDLRSGFEPSFTPLTWNGGTSEHTHDLPYPKHTRVYWELCRTAAAVLSVCLNATVLAVVLTR
jgi:hypothetical protein